jgi:hypothetical protein
VGCTRRGHARRGCVRAGAGLAAPLADVERAVGSFPLHNETETETEKAFKFEMLAFLVFARSSCDILFFVFFFYEIRVMFLQLLVTSLENKMRLRERQIYFWALIMEQMPFVSICIL